MLNDILWLCVTIGNEDGDNKLYINGGADDGCTDGSKVALKIIWKGIFPEGKDNSFLLEIIDGLVAGILDGLLLGFDVSLTVVSDDGFMNGLYFIGVCEIDWKKSG